GDLRYGARQLRLNPGFTAVAVLSLALGIGANSAIFQLIDTLKLKSLPVREPGRLVAVDAADGFRSSGWHSGRHRTFTFAQYEQMVERQEGLTDLAAFGTTRFNLSRSGESRYAQGLYVSPNFLDVLGLAPVYGGWLAADADPRDCTGAGALLDYVFWQREYGGDPGIVGREISLDGHSFPVLGVTPERFFGVEPGYRYQVALPLCADGVLRGGEGRLALREAWWLTPIGRLKPGWSVERASAQMRDASPTIFRETQPDTYRPDTLAEYLDNKLKVIPAHAGLSWMRRQYENPLWILFACTTLVLLIACSNLANLLLARASARQREVALRQAVGASRFRLVAQLMSESLLLAGIGSAAGGLIAYGLSRGMARFLSEAESGVALGLGLDWRVFGYTAALAALTCLLFGLAPALRSAGVAATEAMRGGRGASAGASGNRLRRSLVVVQIALSLVLLVGALLFGQSFRNLVTTDAGLDPEGVLVAQVSAEPLALEPAHRHGLFEQLVQRVGSIPGVVSVASSENYPFSGNSWDQEVHADDDPSKTGGASAWFMRVNPGYFQTMGMPLFAGRDFGSQDTASSPNVAVVNEKFAHDLYGEQNPVGRTFRMEARAGQEDPVYQIVGLVNNSKYRQLREDPIATAFFPVAQGGETPKGLNILVRAKGPLGAVMAGFKREMSEVNPGLLVDFRALEQEMTQTVLRERLMANLSGGFGLLAALLSTLGLYGVMSYMVAKRRSEIGVRLALGAERADIRRLVFGEAGNLLLIGLALGLAGSFALSRYAESLLFGLEPNDALTLALACALLAATAAAAVMMPVRRATSLDPAVVLRDD
ncbi:MAG: ABC transporter permease, partial [Acidobacteria bacterium]|nr:ABC transporter permease [Acidobacteriota bacterium]